MGRESKGNIAKEPPKITQIVILDNGAHWIKVGLATDPEPKIIPNCVAKVKSERRRPFVGDQLEECKDYSGMFYILPFTKGYLTNWDVQRQIWDYIFRTKLRLPHDGRHHYPQIGLLITEPVFNFDPVRRTMIEVFFEEYGFGMVLITSASQMAAFHYLYVENLLTANSLDLARREYACLVVDTGYSFTHVVPFVEGYKIDIHMKRIDIGGKALTNHLKDIVSYRQINVMDETYIVNQMKEDCCYVATKFWQELDKARKPFHSNPVYCDYILPDYIVYKRGFVFDKEQHADLDLSEFQRLRLNNERFQVPELLFHPSDVNLDQIGIPETIIHAVNEFTPNFALSSTIQIEADSMPPPTMRERPENPNYVESSDEDEEEEEYEEEIDEEEETVDEDATEESTDSSSVQTKTNSSNKKTNKNKSNGNQKSSDEPPIEENDDEDEDIRVKYNDENIQAELYNNILLIGGNCCFANIRDRVYEEVRSNVAEMLDVRISMPANPVTYAWHGARLLCSLSDTGTRTGDIESTLYHQLAVSRHEYDQHGSLHCQEKLARYQLPTFSGTPTKRPRTK